jgi:outer membrane immunogenic protein
MLRKIMMVGAFVLVGAGSAYAAEEPWAGPYVGGSIGFDSNKLTVNDRDYFDGLGDNSTQSYGVVVGGQVGYNWQMRGLVYGVEADLSGLSNSKTDNNDSSRGGGAYAQINSKLNGLATIRGRVGVAVDPAFIYLTAGLAAANSTDSYRDTTTNDNVHGNWSSNGVRPGFVVGAGTELYIRSNWTANFEGLYYGLTEKTSSFSHNYGGGVQTYRQSFLNEGILFRGGLNYHFQ